MQGIGAAQAPFARVRMSHGCVYHLTMKFNREPPQVVGIDYLNDVGSMCKSQASLQELVVVLLVPFKPRWKGYPRTHTHACLLTGSEKRGPSGALVRKPKDNQTCTWEPLCEAGMIFCFVQQGPQGCWKYWFICARVFLKSWKLGVSARGSGVVRSGSGLA